MTFGGEAILPAFSGGRCMQTRIMAASPVYTGQVAVQYLQSYVSSWGHLANHGVQMELTVAKHFTLVQFARNYLVAKFLAEPTYTHLLWIDADLGWSYDAPLRMLARGKDVVCGVYPVKSKQQLFPYLAAGPVQADGLQLAERVPAGFMLCTRESIEKVCNAVQWHNLDYQGEKVYVPNVFDLVQEGKDYWGEDFVFCKRLRSQGCEIWVDIDIDFAHIGMNEWRGNLKHALLNAPSGALPQTAMPALKAVES